MNGFRGIPTTYNGVNFRSRLEAKYASIFDQLGWNWEYEPVDLKGWIPDFIIKGVKPIYVEVKPVWNIDEVEKAGKKIETTLGLRSRENEAEALICGAHLPENNFGKPGLGWLWDNWGVAWSPSAVFKLECGGWDICSDVGFFGGRLTGIYEGDHHLDFGSPDLVSIWKDAGNIVQWKAPA